MARDVSIRVEEVAVRIWPGQPFPLGASFDGIGTNFSLFSEVAERVEVCVYLDGNEIRVELPECTDSCWPGYRPDRAAGVGCGFLVYGPGGPEEGSRWC